MLLGCAPAQHQSTAWNMTWNCGNNGNCARAMGAWYGSGSFSNETDCLDWETLFLYDYQSNGNGVYVTSCTGN